MSPEPFGPGWAEFQDARARFLDGLRAGVGGTGAAGRRADAGATDRADEGAGSARTYLVTRREGFDTPRDLEQAAARSRAAGEHPGSGVSWIRTYALTEGGGGLGTVCIFVADSADAIRDHAREAGLPIDEVLLVAGTTVVRPDPAPAGI